MTDIRYKAIGGEQCQNCGRIYKTAWSAPDPLWYRVTEKHGGLLCIDCFDAIASANEVSLTWECRSSKK